MSVSEEKHFKYKLDFYYQSALIYLITLVLYGGIRGNFVEKKFEYVLNDPIMYVIMFFVLVSFLTLALNALRNRQLILDGTSITFHHRWHTWRITAADVEWMHVGRETSVQTSGRFQVIVFKLKKRRRFFRIRVGRYERETELVAEMQRFSAHIPKRKQRIWRRPKFTDR